MCIVWILSYMKYTYTCVLTSIGKSLGRNIPNVSSVSHCVVRIELFSLSSLWTAAFSVLKHKLTAILSQNENNKVISFRKTEKKKKKKKERWVVHLMESYYSIKDKDRLK